jgi:hypothetical protein
MRQRLYEVTCAVALVVMLPGLGGCTLVTIEGSNNTVSDTGGHGGVVLASQPKREEGLYLPFQPDH